MPPVEIHAVHAYEDGLTVVAFCGGAIELFLWHEYGEAQWIDTERGVALWTFKLGVA